MEEDIKILEKGIYYFNKAQKLLLENGDGFEARDINFMKALENLLTRYKQLEEENKELDYKNAHEYRTACKERDKYWKSKVKEKIEEYKQVIEITAEQLKYEENIDVRRRLTTTIEQATAGILALEGLLREE